jgi:hypothetical protein
MEFVNILNPILVTPGVSLQKYKHRAHFSFFHIFSKVMGNRKIGNDTKIFKNMFGNDTNKLKNIFGNDTIFICLIEIF